MQPTHTHTHLWQEQLNSCTQHQRVQKLDPRVAKQVAVLEGVAVQLTQNLAPNRCWKDA